MKDSRDGISSIPKDKLKVELYLDDLKHKGDTNSIIIKKNGTVIVLDVSYEDLLRIVWDFADYFNKDTMNEAEKMFTQKKLVED